jgi:soluble lytic murein transglycosylase-like protein
VLRSALVALAWLALVNGTLNWVGGAGVFLLSPFHLRARLEALRLYALHRPTCLFRGHPALPPLIAAAERREHLPPGLLLAVVEVESGLQTHRISATGAVGAGQLLPSTARGLGVGDPFDSAEAIEGSARYLSMQLRRFHAIRLALAAYNAGPEAVKGDVPDNAETRAYVEQVSARYARHHRALGRDAGAGAPERPSG